MAIKAIFFTVLILASIVMTGCGPSAEQEATMTAMAWTATPTIPTATPIPNIIRWGSTFSTTITPRPTPSRTATIVYRDGTKMVIEDWLFKYNYGETDIEPRPLKLIHYEVQEKTSDNLYLLIYNSDYRDVFPFQNRYLKKSDSLPQITITGNELSRIRYISESEPCHHEGAEIQTKAGEKYYLGFGTTCDWEEFPFRNRYFEVSDSFLNSNMPYLLGKRVILVGWVWQDGQRTEDGYHLGTYAAEEVQEIIFP